MKNLWSRVVLFVLMLTNQFQVGGIYDPYSFKGLLTIFNKENEDLSPVIGAFACSSELLRNIYLWGPDEWKTSILVKQLFHIVIIGDVAEDLLLDQKWSNPVIGFDGELVGNIVSWLKSGKSEQQKKEIVENIVTKHQNAIQKVGGQSGNVVSEKKAKDYLNVIAMSYDFDAQVTLMMLTAVLYLKFDIKKQEMINYLVALQAGMGDGVFTSLLTREKQEELVALEYSDQELNTGSFEKEKAMVRDINSKNFSSNVSPQVLQGRYGFNNHRAVANCAETALNDLLNIIAYNDVEKKFTVTMLPEAVQSSLSPRFRAFYEKYNDPKKVNIPEVQQAFMNMVSGIDGIEYVDGKNYEIEPTIENLLKVVNYLLGINAGTWQELGSLLSTSQREISCEVDEGNFTITFLFNEIESVVLRIEHRQHAYLEYLVRKDNESNDKLSEVKQLLQKSWYDNKNNHWFFLHNMQNKNVMLGCIKEVFKGEFSLGKDIIVKLFHKNYFPVDDYFYCSIFTYIIYPGSEYILMDRRLIDKNSLSEDYIADKLIPIVAASNNLYAQAKLVKYAHLHVLAKKCMGMRGPFESFSKDIIDRLPPDSLQKNEMGITLFGLMMNEKLYNEALHVAKKGGNVFVEPRSMHDFILFDECITRVKDIDRNGSNIIRNRNNANIVRMCLNVFLFCLDSINKNVVDEDGKSFWMIFIEKIVLNKCFIIRDAYDSVVKFLLDLTQKNVLTINIIDKEGKTVLDLLIDKRDQSIKLNEQEEPCVVTVSMMNELIESMRSVGAKTAAELDQEATSSAILPELEQAHSDSLNPS